ncbi:tetratricopeptide repeat protein [Streptomyces sp. LS1784]|uniref:tetratricopeptide repeat protein n=1 Tax=Streptomyces sp. LS1784 TaxID=2851533 RepID=UPI001CCDAFDF|nr:tetratricopeptide repeat protein [Streptomyces sp. LS1784]
MNGPGGRGSGYAVGGRLVLTSAHVTGPTGTRVKVFHPAGTGTADGRVVWSGTPGGRDDAALVLVGDSPHWQPPTAPVRWGRAVTDRPGIPCETWGTPDVAQRSGRAVEAEQLRARLNPGTGFVGNEHVVDLDQPSPVWRANGSSPFAGLSGAAVFCDRLLTGVVAADRAHSAHGRLNAVPAYVLHHDLGFRTALAEWDVGPSGGLQAVEFQDLADRAQDPDRTRCLPSPAALLQARHQIVPFHGRHDLLTELQAWCQLGGFGAWLLHGPGGQGKTRLAHHLAHLLAADGWAVLWPRTTAGPDQLRELRHAAKPLLVVLDYAESRTDQIAVLVEAAADHPANTPLKLLLLARTDGDWWQQATTATSLAEDYLTTARTHHLAPLGTRPSDRIDHYLEAARALADACHSVDGLTAHDWSTLAGTLRPPQLDQDAYGNALTLHMTALADLLDTADARPHSTSDSTDLAAASSVRQEADLVEDRLLVHERRHWRQAVLTLAPALSLAILETALAAAHLMGAADREQADRLWQRLPALADQTRDQRNSVTNWLTALYPAPAPGGQPWGSLQPDRLAERHIGRALDDQPELAEHLVDGADDIQTAQLLIVYSRAAAHPVFYNRLNTHLTNLCVRHYQRLAPQTAIAATHTNHPQPLVDALDALVTTATVPLDDLDALHDGFPLESQRLAVTAVRLAYTIADRTRALAEADPDTYTPDLAMALNNLSHSLGEVGRREESLAAIEEAVAIRRTLAAGNPNAHLPGLANALTNLSHRLGEVGRGEEGLPAVEEAVAIRRTLAAGNPDADVPGLARALTNLSNRLGDAGRHEEGLAAGLETIGHYRTLAAGNPDTYLPDLAMALTNLSNRLGDTGRHEEGLAASLEATGHYRTLAADNPDTYLSYLAGTLNNLSNRLGEVGRQEESLAAIHEATGHYRTLAADNPNAHLPHLAGSIYNLSNRLSEVGRREESMAAIEEAVAIRRTLAAGNPNAHLPDLAHALHKLSARLSEVGRREESMAAIEEAVAIRRTLVTGNPNAHLPDLAHALHKLSLCWGEVGRWEEAVATVRETVAIRRGLAEDDPGTHLPGLAQSLHNLSVWLDRESLPEEALAAAYEATWYFRTLAKTNHEAYLTGLAWSLNDLSSRLERTGQLQEALAATQESVAIRLVLAQANLDAHLPGLATGYYNLSIRLNEVGRRAEALTAIHDAIYIQRALAQANPAIFEAALQQSLDAATWFEILDP